MSWAKTRWTRCVRYVRAAGGDEGVPRRRLTCWASRLGGRLATPTTDQDGPRPSLPAQLRQGGSHAEAEERRGGEMGVRKGAVATETGGAGDANKVVERNRSDARLPPDGHFPFRPDCEVVVCSAVFQLYPPPPELGPVLAELAAYLMSAAQAGKRGRGVMLYLVSWGLARTSHLPPAPRHGQQLVFNGWPQPQSSPRAPAPFHCLHPHIEVVQAGGRAFADEGPPSLHPC